MFKRLIGQRSVLVAAGVALIGLAGCGSQSTSGPASSSFPKLSLRINHGITADSYEGQALDYFAKRVSDLTGGQVTVQVFHNAQLGDDEQSLTEVQTGTLDMSLDSLYENAVTAGTVFDLPFLFPDEATWAKAVTGKPGQLVKNSATGASLHLLGLWMGGWRDEYGNRPLHSIDDFKGLKIRTIQVKAYVKLFSAIGAVSTPMPFSQVYLALQQHTIDAAETDLQSMYSAKQYEVVKYASRTHHGLSTVGLIVNQQRWDGLPQNVRNVLQQAESDAFKMDLQKYDQVNDQVQQQLEAKGITFTKVDTAPIRAIAKSQVYPEIVTDATQNQVLQAVENLSS
ncbi:MAG TPA: TRAP transporter substrate-binding protein [Candidatus Dormibacteraeota bacterium]